MKNKPIVIGDQTVQPGEKQMVSLEAPSLYVETPIRIPTYIFNGEKSGPRLFLIGTIHGDELNSVQIIRRIISYPHLIKKLRGTLIAVPVANIYGFASMTRILPDNRDLNRAFPGSKQGSLAARLAYLLTTEVINQCTHGIDFHTAAVNRTNLPQIRIDPAVHGTLSMAKAFNAPVILETKLRPGSMREISTARNIPLLVYEGGQGMRFDKVAIRSGIQGILNVLSYLRMLPPPKKPVKFSSKIARASNWVRMPASGIVTHLKPLGALFKRHETLAIISNPFTNEETVVVAPKKGIVIGKNNLPILNEGDPLLHIAYFQKTRGLVSAIENLENIDFEEWYDE